MRLSRHQGTRALEGHLCISALKVLLHSGTQKSLGHVGTQKLGYLGTQPYSALHELKFSFKKSIVRNMYALFMNPHLVNLILKLFSIIKQKTSIALIKPTRNKSSKTNQKALIINAVKNQQLV